MPSNPDKQHGKVVEEARVPIVEERVLVEKREVEGRTVTVRTRPVSETVMISEPIQRETIEVERRPVDRVIESVPEVQETDDLTIIPVVEERFRVVRELVLVEEVHLHRKRHTVEETVEVERFRTEVDIDE